MNDCDYENKEFDIENSLQASIPFPYEEVDKGEPEKHFDISAVDVIIRLASVIFSSKKPKVHLAAILYASNVDVGIYLECENTVTAIAKQLGESKQNFSILIKKMREEFGLKHCNTGKTIDAKQKYKSTNYKKQKYE
jgi:hypothetical protein